MHEARRYWHGQCDIPQEIDVLENEVNMHMCIAESSKSRQIGELRMLIVKQKHLDML